MSVSCEICHRAIKSQEVTHGIRYGTTDPITDLFLPSRDSAYTILCQSCGETLLKLVYQKLNPAKAHYTSLFR